MQPAVESNVSPAEVLTRAAANAARIFGLNRQELGRIIGRDRTSISRGIDPDSKSGELALLLIRCYRDLAVLVGQDQAAVRHWFSTDNRHLGGVPRDLVMTVQGLVQVTEYLDAMRGKV